MEVTQPYSEQKMSSDDKSSLYEIFMGIILIFAQFFLNRSFIGTGYSKFYFDVVLFGLLFLIILTSLNKGFIKIVILFSFFFFTSATLLNHLNVISSLANITSFGFLGSNFMVVFYYILMIILTTVFAASLNKEDSQKIIEFCALSIASLILPFIITNIPAVNYFLVQEGMSLVRLFFSIPLLWQPFFISGIFKAKEKGSTVAKFYSFFWLLIILLITFIASYAAVPAQDRANLQELGSNTINSGIQDLQQAINETQNLLEKNIYNPIKYGFDTSSQIESQIDTDQQIQRQGVKIKKTEFSESSSSEPIIDFSPNSVQKYTSWLDLEADEFEDNNFYVQINCSSKLKAYEGFFVDDSISEINFQGSITGSNENTITIPYDDLLYGTTIICDMDKNEIKTRIKPERIENIQNSAYFSVNHDLKYNFSTAGYMTRYFIDSQIYDELRISSKGDTSEIYSQLNIKNPSQYETSHFTSGPLRIGLEFSQDSVLIPVQSDGIRLSINSEISLDTNYGYNNEIENISLVLLIPKELELNLELCSPFIFEKRDSLGIYSNLVSSTENLNIYIIEDMQTTLNSRNEKIRFSCPIINSENLDGGLLKSSIGIYAYYNVKTKKTTNIGIVYDN